MACFNSQDPAFGSICFISRRKDTVILFAKDKVTGESLLSDDFESSRFDFRKGQESSSPLLLSKVGTIENLTDKTDGKTKRAIVIILTKEEKLILQGSERKSKVFGTIYAVGKKEVPVFYGTHTIKGIA